MKLKIVTVIETYFYDRFDIIAIILCHVTRSFLIIDFLLVIDRYKLSSACIKLGVDD